MVDESHAITAEQLKPAACAGLTLGTIITDGDDGTTDGTINGTTGNDLLLGTDGPNTLNGGGGIDCFVAGSGVDTCNGGAGTDVFIDCETETP